ncbi:MAG: acetamidase/formamidase family protein [Candidatus Latescibacteria bacterium]|nr:acetamidase/formamidase family protein [Candidatus Latescibacterota bacterium]
MRHFTRTPFYSGPDDPEMGQVRGKLALDETVVIETIGGADNDYEAAGFLKVGQIISGDSHRRYARPGGPFFIEGIEPDDWVAIEIINMEVGPYGFYRNGGPNWGNWRCLAAVRDGLIHFPPDFVVPVRPMIGVIQLASWAPSGIDHGGNMDFNAIQPGSTVHIRAQKPGGLLSLGDVHARMGDGELTGAGVEIDAAITLKVSRSPGFPCSAPVVETTGVVESAEEWLTSARAEHWGEALRLAWTEMVALLIDRYDTTYEYANMIVGTIGDARPGFATGYMGGYVTCQIAVTKELRRTGEPYKP